MKTFKQFVEGMPTQRMGAGGDPTMSALAKINKNQGQMPFDGGYNGPSVFKQVFGLDDQEMNALYKLKLTKQGTGQYGGGFSIDKNRFNQVYQQLMKMSPDAYKPQQMTPPPPQKMAPGQTIPSPPLPQKQVKPNPMQGK